MTGIDVDDHYLRQARRAIRKFDLEDLIHLEKRSVYSLARAETRDWRFVGFAATP